MTPRDHSVTPKRTQCERVLQAAERPQGTCQAEWLDPAPHGLPGPRITRVAARIQDLESAGHTFEVLPDRNGTRVYRLAGVVQGAAGSSSPPQAAHTHSSGLPSRALQSTGRLFEPPAEPHWKAEAA